MNKHEDERGTIEDLKVGKDWSVTYISFKKGAVRGNHYHKETTQTDYILSGSLTVCRADEDELVTETVRSGEKILHNPYVRHAYKALEDSEMISICFGKRIGDNYESDTFRLDEKLI